MAERGAVVITGASTGIGEHCAIGLAARGYRVFAGVRKPMDGERLRADGGENVVPLTIDVTEQVSIDAAKQAVEESLADIPLRGLFNNAGLAVNGPFEFVSPKELRWQLEVNCVGQLAVTQAFLPMLRASKGRIINTGSVGGFVAVPVVGPYCMSKFALEAFSDSLRVELLPQGIHVALLEAGAVATKIWDKGIDDFEALIAKGPEDLREHYGMFMKRARKLAEQERAGAAPPSVVLDAVVHALEARAPKARYRMGAGVRQRELLRRLPDRWRDKVILAMFGIRL